VTPVLRNETIAARLTAAAPELGTALAVLAEKVWSFFRLRGVRHRSETGAEHSAEARRHGDRAMRVRLRRFGA